MTAPPLAVLSHWADELGCPPEYLGQPGTYLLRSPRVALNRFVLLRTEVSAILQVSMVLEDRAERGALLGSGGRLAPEALAAEQLIDRLAQLPLSMAWTEAVFCGAGAGQVAERQVAGVPTSPAARELRGGDARRVQDLVAAAGEREAFLSGIAGTQPPLYGSFEGDALCAVAGHEPRQGVVAGVRVLTAPARRRRGHGTAAVAATMQGALAQGEYAVLSVAYGNRAGMRLCRRLGLDQVAVEEGMELVA